MEVEHFAEGLECEISYAIQYHLFDERLKCLEKGTLLRLFKKSGSDNPLLFHYLTPLPRVNRRARPRVVAINHGYRYLRDVQNGGYR